MKRFTLLSVVTLALLAPTIAYGDGARFTYRPELKQWVVVPSAPQAAATAVTPTPNDVIARHEAMAAFHRGGRMAHMTAHCDRMIANARATLRKQS